MTISELSKALDIFKQYDEEGIVSVDYGMQDIFIHSPVTDPEEVTALNVLGWSCPSGDMCTWEYNYAAH